MKKCSQSLGLCLNHTTLLIFEILTQSFSLCYIIEYSPPLRPKWVEHCPWKTSNACHALTALLNSYNIYSSSWTGIFTCHLEITDENLLYATQRDYSPTSAPHTIWRKIDPERIVSRSHLRRSLSVFILATLTQGWREAALFEWHRYVQHIEYLPVGWT